MLLVISKAKCQSKLGLKPNDDETIYYNDTLSKVRVVLKYCNKDSFLVMRVGGADTSKVFIHFQIEYIKTICDNCIYLKKNNEYRASKFISKDVFLLPILSSLNHHLLFAINFKSKTWLNYIETSLDSFIYDAEKKRILTLSPFEYDKNLKFINRVFVNAYTIEKNDFNYIKSKKVYIPTDSKTNKSLMKSIIQKISKMNL